MLIMNLAMDSGKTASTCSGPNFHFVGAGKRSWTGATRPWTNHRPLTMTMKENCTEDFSVELGLRRLAVSVLPWGSSTYMSHAAPHAIVWPMGREGRVNAAGGAVACVWSNSDGARAWLGGPVSEIAGVARAILMKRRD